MSSFCGKMKEYSNLSLDRFDGRNLQSTAFFLSHCHSDHMEGLNHPDFAYCVKSRKNIYLYCSEITRAILLANEQYSHLQEFIRILQVNRPQTIVVPSTVEGQEDSFVTVTAISAGHCPGSVMFLFEGTEGTVLYTGDFRWDLNQVANTPAFREGEKVKHIKSLYIDTTFCQPEAYHIPSRTECVEATLGLVTRWLQESPLHVVFFACPAHYGHEYLLAELACRVGTQVHVSETKAHVYAQIPSLNKLFTDRPHEARIHACEFVRGHPSAYNLACGHRPGGGEKYRIRNIRPSTMWFTSENTEARAEDLVVPPKSGGLYRVCYSMHSSYSEIRDVVSFLQPDQVFPNVIPTSDSSSAQVQARLNGFLSYPHKLRMKPAQRNETEFIPLEKLNPVEQTTPLKDQQELQLSGELVFSSPDSSQEISVVRSKENQINKTHSGCDTSTKNLALDPWSSDKQQTSSSVEDVLSSRENNPRPLDVDKTESAVIQSLCTNASSSLSYVSGDSDVSDNEEEEEEDVQKDISVTTSTRVKGKVTNTYHGEKASLSKKRRRSPTVNKARSNKEAALKELEIKKQNDEDVQKDCDDNSSPCSLFKTEESSCSYVSDGSDMDQFEDGVNGEEERSTVLYQHGSTSVIAVNANCDEEQKNDFYTNMQKESSCLYVSNHSLNKRKDCEIEKSTNLFEQDPYAAVSANFEKEQKNYFYTSTQKESSCLYVSDNSLNTRKDFEIERFTNFFQQGPSSDAAVIGNFDKEQKINFSKDTEKESSCLEVSNNSDIDQSIVEVEGNSTLSSKLAASSNFFSKKSNRDKKQENDFCKEAEKRFEKVENLKQETVLLKETEASTGTFIEWTQETVTDDKAWLKEVDDETYLNKGADVESNCSTNDSRDIDIIPQSPESEIRAKRSLLVGKSPVLSSSQKRKRNLFSSQDNSSSAQKHDELSVSRITRPRSEEFLSNTKERYGNSSPSQKEQDKTTDTSQQIVLDSDPALVEEMSTRNKSLKNGETSRQENVESCSRDRDLVQENIEEFQEVKVQARSKESELTVKSAKNFRKKDFQTVCGSNKSHAKKSSADDIESSEEKDVLTITQKSCENINMPETDKERQLNMRYKNCDRPKTELDECFVEKVEFTQQRTLSVDPTPEENDVEFLFEDTQLSNVLLSQGWTSKQHRMQMTQSFQDKYKADLLGKRKGNRAQNRNGWKRRAVESRDDDDDDVVDLTQDG